MVDDDEALLLPSRARNAGVDASVGAAPSRCERQWSARQGLQKPLWHCGFRAEQIFVATRSERSRWSSRRGRIAPLERSKASIPGEKFFCVYRSIASARRG